MSTDMSQKCQTMNACDQKPTEGACGGATESVSSCPITWFRDMVNHCYEYAAKRKEEGAPIVGIMCEYTPRELIMAAGAVPICLCGGSNKMIPAAEQSLPSNLCPLIKSTFGYGVKKANPFLEMADLVIGETTCDGKKKMYEIMGRERAMHVLELPQKPDDPVAMDHWLNELRILKGALEERFGGEITREKLNDAIRGMNRERGLKRRLAELMKSDEPSLTGRELLDMKSLISCMPADMEQYEKALEMLPGRQIDPPASGRVRTLLTGVPSPHGAERVMDIIEAAGGLVVCQENCTGIKPVLDDVEEDSDDPMRVLARKYFEIPCSVMTSNRRRFETLDRLIDDYRPQCVIELVWQACLTYDVESYYTREFARERNLPYLRIETDYSPSDSERIALRVEALFETARSRDAS